MTSPVLAPLEAGRWTDAIKTFQTEGDLRGAAVDHAVNAFSDAQRYRERLLKVSADAQSDLESRSPLA